MLIGTSEVMFGEHQSSSWADVLKPAVEIIPAAPDRSAGSVGECDCDM